MQNIESLSDLFSAVGCHATFYDVGRHITKITPQQVIAFDKKQQVYPYAFRQQAWLACVLSEQNHSSSDNLVIWFLRLPLDESGCLNLGTRDHFIKSIVDKIMHKGTEQGLNEALEDNPYAFKPDQDRLANLHAIMARDLKQPASEYYSAVLEYLKKDNLQAEENWSQLGLQGLADLAAQPDNEAAILTALEHAPEAVVFPLCHALEHHTQSTQIIETVCRILQHPTMDAASAAHWIRAISRSEFPQLLFIPLFTLLGDITDCSDEQLELIATLVTKCPHWLDQQPQLLRIILEKLAHRNDAQLGFKQVVNELTQQPQTRASCWSVLRATHASSTLQSATASLLTPTSQTLQ